MKFKIAAAPGVDYAMFFQRTAKRRVSICRERKTAVKATRKRVCNWLPVIVDRDSVGRVKAGEAGDTDHGPDLRPTCQRPSRNRCCHCLLCARSACRRSWRNQATAPAAKSSGPVSRSPAISSNSIMNPDYHRCLKTKARFWTRCGPVCPSCCAAPTSFWAMPASRSVQLANHVRAGPGDFNQRPCCA